MSARCEITDKEWAYAIQWALHGIVDQLSAAKTRAAAIRILKERRLHAGRCGPYTPWVNGVQRGLDVRSRDDSRRSLITWGEVVDYVRQPQQLMLDMQLEVQP